MFDNYIQVFWLKVLIIFSVISLLTVFWLYRLYSTNLKQLTESQKLKQIWTGIGAIWFMFLFLYSLIIVAIYWDKVTNNMIGFLGLWLSLLWIMAWVFDIVYRKKIKDKIYSQFGNILLWSGSIAFIFIVLVYLKDK